ncbi:hypothetical protein Plhal304r1_c033g0105181 [Plasmopara halstedii]
MLDHIHLISRVNLVVNGALRNTSTDSSRYRSESPSVLALNDAYHYRHYYFDKLSC